MVADPRQISFPVHSVKIKFRSADFFVCAFLIAAVFAVFGQTIQHEFVNYDDEDYVVDNLSVRNGVSWSGIQWAFAKTHSGNWHPITWISHMIDCQFFGLNAGAHHLMNVGIHAASAVLLFLALLKLTGRDGSPSRPLHSARPAVAPYQNLWRSAFVAALFALHPLHVESVAWVSERKDVLSGFFWMLTLLAYAAYVERRTVLRYLLVLSSFALGLMAKPMLVTLPLILLLLDYWPLGRFGRREIEDRKSQIGDRQSKIPQRFAAANPSVGGSVVRGLVVEKIPLFVLSVISSVIAFLAQADAVAPLNKIALSVRIENALVSYATYVVKIFWPVHLAVIYPLRTTFDLSEVVAAASLLIGISVLVIWLRRGCRYAPVGWLWYLITLLPVIGLIQVGFQSMADRYTYIPSVGLFICITWAAADIAARFRVRRAVLVSAAGVVLIACGIGTWHQLQYWRNSGALFSHALAVTKDNYVAENSLGDVLTHEGKVSRAVACYAEAVRLKPDYVEAYCNLGDALARGGRLQDAIAAYAEALRILPKSVEAHSGLGDVLVRQRQLEEGVSHYEAIVRFWPNSARGHFQFGKGLVLLGRPQEAVGEFREALRLWPERVEVSKNLAWILATNKNSAVRNGSEAVGLAERLCKLTGYNDAEALDTLAAAYAEVGRFGEAIKTAETAKDLANSAHADRLATEIRDRLELYKLNLPYHEK
jgi:tetratricopeptide (TPR) repeat protein